MQERRLLSYITQDDIPSTAVEWNPNNSDSANMTGNVLYLPLSNNNLAPISNERSMQFPMMYNSNRTYANSYNGVVSYYYIPYYPVIVFSFPYYSKNVVINDTYNGTIENGDNFRYASCHQIGTLYAGGIETNNYGNNFTELSNYSRMFLFPGSSAVKGTNASSTRSSTSNNIPANAYAKIKFNDTFSIIDACLKSSYRGQIKQDGDIVTGWSTWEYPIYIDTE